MDMATDFTDEDDDLSHVSTDEDNDLCPVSTDEDNDLCHVSTDEDDDLLSNRDYLSEEEQQRYDELWETTLLGCAFWRDQRKNRRFYDAIWKDTLMGAEFWRERDRTNPYDSTYHDPIASSFYPVALQKHILADGDMDKGTLRAVIAGSTDNGPFDPEANEDNMSLNEPFYLERRRSMSDLRPLEPGPLAPGPLAPGAKKKRFWQFSKKAAEDYDVIEKRRPRTGKSFIRSALGFSGIRNRNVQQIQEVQEGDSQFDFGFDPHPGSEENPLLYFRGGASWKYIERNLDVLCLDLFWPIKKNTPRNNDMIKITELRPLCTFRHLRVLKITGMMQSYQQIIWQVVWLNPDLEELELEMALEPTIKPEFKAHWPSIGPGWKIGEQEEGVRRYYGAGDGTIRNSIGTGEYLDKGLIESAGVLAYKMGSTMSRLPLVVIKLAGFIVDGDPFSLFFEPRRLRRIQFKHNCIDSGFYLDAWMKDKVQVIYPKKAVSNIAQTARVVNLAKELKVIELSKGKKISEAPYRPPGGFHQGCHHHHHGKMPAGTCGRDKNKENEHCCGKKTDDKGKKPCHHGMTAGGQELDNSTDKKKVSELKSTGQSSSMATPTPRPKGAPRHGRNAILPRMMGKLAHKSKPTTEKE